MSGTPGNRFKAVSRLHKVSDNWYPISGREAKGKEVEVDLARFSLVSLVEDGGSIQLLCQSQSCYTVFPAILASYLIVKL